MAVAGLMGIPSIQWSVHIKRKVRHQGQGSRMQLGSEGQLICSHKISTVAQTPEKVYAGSDNKVSELCIVPLMEQIRSVCFHRSATIRAAWRFRKQCLKPSALYDAIEAVIVASCCRAGYYIMYHSCSMLLFVSIIVIFCGILCGLFVVFIK